MRIALIFAAIITAGICHTSSAHADGWFFSEGFGMSEIGGELGEHFDGAGHLRVSLGRRFGRVAVEGFIMGNFLEGRSAFNGGFHDITSLGLSARYMFPVGRNLELYLRGGLHTSMLSVEDADTWDSTRFRGRGIHYGAGAQVKRQVPVLGLLFFPFLFSDIGPKMTGSLWIETTHHINRLHHDNYASVDSTIKSWTFGFGAGSDF